MSLDTVHVLPINDLFDHVESVRCPCEPRQPHDHLIIHNSFDRRELFEDDKTFSFKEWVEKKMIVFRAWLRVKR